MQFIVSRYLYTCHGHCCGTASRVAIFRISINLPSLPVNFWYYGIGCKPKRRKPQPVLQQSVLYHWWTVDNPTVECMEQTIYCLYQEHWVLVEENLLLKKQVVGENHRQAKGSRTLSTASLHLHATGESTVHVHSAHFVGSAPVCKWWLQMRTIDCM